MPGEESMRAAIAGVLLLGCQAVPGGAAPAPGPQAIADTQLARLARFGEVPPCRIQETIVPLTPEEQAHQTAALSRGERILVEDHHHVQTPMPRIARLAGQTAAIRPFLESDSQRVVHRAADLLCSVQDDAAKEAIADLAARQPCLRFLPNALEGAGIDPATGPGKRAREAVAAALADDGCVHSGGVTECAAYTRSRCDRELSAAGPEWMPGSAPARASEKLLHGSGGAGFRELLRARAASYSSLGNWYADRASFIATDGAAALAEAARRSSRSEGEILRDASRGMSTVELDDLYEVAMTLPKALSHGRAEVEALAPAEAKRKDLPAAEQAFWHVLAHDGVLPARELCSAGMSAPRYIFSECRKVEQAATQSLDQLLAAKDGASLRSFMNDTSQDLTKRLLAATYLLQLGDDAGFPLLEKLPTSDPEMAGLRGLALSTLKFTKVPPALKARMDSLIAAVEKADAPSEEQRRKLLDSLKAR
jgi:hypothetical protein